MEIYFDNKELLKYLDTKAKLKVFVDGEWVNITDKNDLEDNTVGVGYDNSGAAVMFDYRDVEQVKAGSRQMTKDQLQTKANSSADQKKPSKNPAADEAPPEDEGGEEPEASEEPEPMEEPEPIEEPEEPEGGGPSPQRSSYDPYMIGRNIIRESNRVNSDRNRGKLVKILDKHHEFFGYRGTIIESYGNQYDIRLLNWKRNETVLVEKNLVKFI